LLEVHIEQESFSWKKFLIGYNGVETLLQWPLESYTSLGSKVMHVVFLPVYLSCICFYYLEIKRYLRNSKFYKNIFQGEDNTNIDSKVKV
jgi:hypothetical protein